MFPTAVLPEILAGILAHERFEPLREADHDVIHVALAIVRMRDRNFLGNKHISTVLLAQRLHEQHGHIATQGKNGAPARVLAGRPKNGTMVDASPTVA